MTTEQMFCTSCGAAFPAWARFCGSCGSARDGQPRSTSDVDASERVGTIGSGLWDGLTGKPIDDADRTASPLLNPGNSPPSSSVPERGSGPYRRLAAAVWGLAAAIALIMFSLEMFDEPLNRAVSKLPIAGSYKLAVVRERFPPTQYPPMPAYSTLEIQSLEDQEITVTNVVINNNRECSGLILASFPQKLSTGHTIKVLPSCDPVKVVVSTNRGEQVYTWIE